MAKKYKPKWKVPFTADGNMLGFPKNYTEGRRRAEERENYIFEATLRLLFFDSGDRSARRLWFEDKEEEHRYCMFISELKGALLNCDVNGTEFEGKWTFRKQGQEYSIVAVGPTACPHCDEVPKPDDDGRVCHECSGARFWSTREDWELSVKRACDGKGTDSSQSHSPGGGTVSICTPSGMHPVGGYGSK